MVGIFAFATLELVAGNGDLPENVAIATLVYSADDVGRPWPCMAWTRGSSAGEAFSVYFNLFSRISPWSSAAAQRSGCASRCPASRRSERCRATVPLLAVMIGSVSFDGVRRGAHLDGYRDAGHRPRLRVDLGLSPERALEATFFVGLVGGVVPVYGFYRLGIAGARSVGGTFVRRARSRFVHSLVPIAFAYVAAHYLTQLLYQGQATDLLASNPLGQDGTDFFGTADRAIDYGVIGATTAWYYQVGFVVVGHVAALTLAHDRALVIYDKAEARRALPVLDARGDGRLH